MVKNGKTLENLVGVVGFEPTTPASRTQCSTGLSHTPTTGGGVIAKGFAYRKNWYWGKNLSKNTPVTADLVTKLLSGHDQPEETAAQTLQHGGLVAFPTETVYGLGADATQPEAVARLYQAKGRPAFNPLIAHVADLNAAQAIARFDARSLKLARAFWPGPLTLVVPKTPDCFVVDLATAGLDTIAVRVPSHPLAQRILRAFGKPVVAPSANLSGHVSPTTAAHVQSDLNGRIDLIIDGGPVVVGVESTIIGCFDRAMMLRPGGLARRDIEDVLGEVLSDAPTDNHPEAPHPLAPGMLASHYAPRAGVRLNAAHVNENEALLAFGERSLSGITANTTTLNLSARGSLVEAAANLFGHLRALDATGVRTIAVMPIPEEGLGEAINDRLRRAAIPQ
jgi:L-threonylcarbamoyladenylate synthase